MPWAALSDEPGFLGPARSCHCRRLGFLGLGFDPKPFRPARSRATLGYFVSACRDRGVGLLGVAGHLLVSLLVVGEVVVLRCELCF